MKPKYIPWIVILVIIIIVKCASNNNNDDNDQVTQAIEILPDIEVEFNESDGEASLTKNLYILFDGSGSMDDFCAGKRKIEGAKTAVVQYINKIPEDYNLGLLVFGTQYAPGYQELVELGPTNHQKIIEAIQQVHPEKSTPLASSTAVGVEKLIDQYKKQLGYGEYRLVIVTDGIANEPDRFETALKEANRYSFIAIYGIGLCINGSHTLKAYSLSYTDADDYEKLGKALEKTIGELQDFDPTEFDFEELTDKE